MQQPHPQVPATGSPAGNEMTEEYDPYDQKSVERYWANKQKETQKLLDEKLNQFAQYTYKQAVNTALSRGKQIVAQNPEIFKGNENEVMTMVNNLAMTGNVAPDILENPTTWFGINDMVRGEKARKQSQATAMPSTVVDTPSQVRTQEPVGKIDKSIDPDIVEMLYGGDWELATKKTRESRERGER